MPQPPCARWTIFIPFRNCGMGGTFYTAPRMDGHAIAAPAPSTPVAPRTRPNLRQFFRAALFLGVVGFGGGLSVLANIHSLVVKRRRWLTDREFANTVTVSQMLPGG